MKHKLVTAANLALVLFSTSLALETCDSYICESELGSCAARDGTNVYLNDMACGGNIILWSNKDFRGI